MVWRRWVYERGWNFPKGELKKEGFIYRLPLACFGQVPRLHFVGEGSES